MRRRDVETWVAEQQASGRAAATIRSRWIALRSLLAGAVSAWGERDQAGVAQVRQLEADK